MLNNPTGLQGIEFVEFSSPYPDKLHQLFLQFGFSFTRENKEKSLHYYEQNEIRFLINQTPSGHAKNFQKKHGPSICSMGLKVNNAKEAFHQAVSRGAKIAQGELFLDESPIPAIYGIGDSLIYFIEKYNSAHFYTRMGLEKKIDPMVVPEKGFVRIDHLTNNVAKGTMNFWADFYKNIFGFTEVRYFDIRGAKTGLTSYALKSPCQTFCIPINEGTESKSQINEYLEEYQGPGIQHLAFLTNDIVKSLDSLQGSSIETLLIDDDYYREIFHRVKNVTEDHDTLRRHNILIDGDEEGYLLQIFTKNLIGPIFIEIIQRKNHHSFGEGNFSALFRSIEKDQERRGYLT